MERLKTIVDGAASWLMGVGLLVLVLAVLRFLVFSGYPGIVVIGEMDLYVIVSAIGGSMVALGMIVKLITSKL